MATLAVVTRALRRLLKITLN